MLYPSSLPRIVAFSGSSKNLLKQSLSGKVVDLLREFVAPPDLPKQAGEEQLHSH